MIYEGGISWMRYSVSESAEYGDYVSGPRVINDTSKQALRQILTEIQDGTFAANLADEWDTGAKTFAANRAAGKDHQIEQVGRKVRDMIPFITTPTEGF